VIALLILPTLALAYSYSVTQIRGSEAFFSPQGSTTRSVLNSGASLPEGNTVETGNRTTVSLLSSNGHRLHIAPRTALFLDSAPGGRTSLVELLRGAARSEVRRSGEKTFELRSRSIAVGVRGTDFLAVLEEPVMHIYLREGALLLQGQELMAAGKKAAIHTNGTILSVEPMRAGEFEESLERAGFGFDAPSSAPLPPVADEAPDSRTPLMKAIARRDTQAVKRLLEGGADKNEKDASGRTAFDYARESADKAIQDLIFR
jgi:hypothetical protein